MRYFIHKIRLFKKTFVFILNMPHTKKNILVYGVGSLGSYLATVLFNTDHRVDCVGREKANKIGDTIYVNDEKFKFPKVYSEIDPNKHYDYIFITSKYFDLKRNLEDLVDSGIRFDTLVLIQNTYIDNIWYYHLIKDKPIVTLSVVEGFNLKSNKLVFRPATGWFVEDDILGKDVYNLLKEAGVNISLINDINLKRAEKSLANCSINIFSAYYQATLREIFSDKKILKEMQEIFDETYDVLSEIVPLRSKKSLWRSFLSTYKGLDHYASTYQDVMNKSKTELVYLNGFIVDLSRKLEIDAPFTLEMIKRFKEKYPGLY
jgi:2-dehydropantoate 2-reductase